MKRTLIVAIIMMIAYAVSAEENDYGPYEPTTCKMVRNIGLDAQALNCALFVCNMALDDVKKERHEYAEFFDKHLERMVEYAILSVQTQMLSDLGMEKKKRKPRI